MSGTSNWNPGPSHKSLTEDKGCPSYATQNFTSQAQNFTTQPPNFDTRTQNFNTESQKCEQSQNDGQNLKNEQDPNIGAVKEEIVVALDPTNHLDNEEDLLNLSCLYCKQTYPTIAELMKHRITHITTGFFREADITSMTIPNPPYNFHSIFDSFTPHNTVRNLEEDPLAEEITLPKIPDEEKKYPCPICQKRLSNKSSLSRHVKAHTSTESFPCDICQKVFTRKAHLETHKKLHTGIKPFECQICLKVFSQMSYLKGHQKAHRSEKKYACSICFKRFKSCSAFRTHEAIVHNGVKKWKCTFENCGKAFTRKAQWQLHERIHTGVKPYQCTICLRNFARNCTLHEHMMTHSVIKPFFCEICNKQYARKSQLVLHVRVHSDIKPFKCEICNKQYTLNSSLKYHKKIHEKGDGEMVNIKRKSKSEKVNKKKKNSDGTRNTVFQENIFICDTCGEQYKSKYKLIRHLRNKHESIFK